MRAEETWRRKWEVDEVCSQLLISVATFIHLIPCRDHKSESHMQTLGYVAFIPYSCMTSTIIHNYCIQAGLADHRGCSLIHMWYSANIAENKYSVLTQTPRRKTTISPLKMTSSLHYIWIFSNTFNNTLLFQYNLKINLRKFETW